VTRPPIDRHWLEVELDELALLVDKGETLELIGRLNALVANPRRSREHALTLETEDATAS
jgi:hypothetical protein